MFSTRTFESSSGPLTARKFMRDSVAIARAIRVLEQPASKRTGIFSACDKDRPRSVATARRTWRAVEQHSSRGAHAKTGESLRMQQRPFDDLRFERARP